LVLELWLGDYAGNVLGAKCSYKMQSLEPDIDEIVAASEAVIFCKDVGLRDVIMEGDALNVVKEINSAPPYLSRLGHFVEAIKKEFDSFNSIFFIHVSKDLNSATHILAKEASRLCLDHVWLEETPNCIHNVVIREQVVPRS
jgi:hypothetical protein